MAINIFVFSGNCGGDMEIKYTPSGIAIGTVSVPCKSGWGEKEKTTWITCKWFKERAERLAPYITKGALVTISGRFELEQWERDGVKHSRPVCIVDDVQLSQKGTQSNGQSAPARGQGQNHERGGSQGAPQQGHNQSQGGGFSDFEDDIPFLQHERGSVI